MIGMGIEKRDFSLDFVKALAIVMVVVVHTSYPYLNDIETVGAKMWTVIVFIRTFSGLGVLLFLMTSGLLLIGKKEESGAIFFKKRISKVIIPFLIWSFVYWCWEIYVFGEQKTLSDFLPALLREEVVFHF